MGIFETRLTLVSRAREVAAAILVSGTLLACSGGDFAASDDEGLAALSAPSNGRKGPAAKARAAARAAKFQRATSEVAEPARTIRLVIDPRQLVRIKGSVDMTAAYLAGFDFLKDQVTLLSVSPSVFLHPHLGGGGDFEYFEAVPLLEDGILRSYPLSHHRQVKADVSSAELRISVLDSRDNSQPIELPDDMRRNLLRYFAHDAFTPRNCLDFADEVALASPAYRWRIPGMGPFEAQRDESDIQVGDVIALLSEPSPSAPEEEPSGASFKKGDPSAKATRHGQTARHYAVALGRGLYLSKLGNRGVYAVMTLDAMQTLYKGTQVARINLGSDQAIPALYDALPD